MAPNQEEEVLRFTIAATVIVVAFVIVVLCAYRSCNARLRVPVTKISPPSSKGVILKPTSNNEDMSRYDYMAQV